MYRREAAGDLAGEITGVTDGAGRESLLLLPILFCRCRTPSPFAILFDNPPPLPAPAASPTIPRVKDAPPAGPAALHSAPHTRPHIRKTCAARDIGGIHIQKSPYTCVVKDPAIMKYPTSRKTRRRLARRRCNVNREATETRYL